MENENRGREEYVMGLAPTKDFYTRIRHFITLEKSLPFFENSIKVYLQLHSDFLFKAREKTLSSAHDPGSASYNQLLRLFLGGDLVSF
ncbi:unnamed protein product [Amoebophrya sp. A120]|nr:unnamed protein product [Amoebophrya sp. A120]|eukprot:GSA120T00013104001.1